MYCVFFFFNDTATTEIYTLSLHDALPIFERAIEGPHGGAGRAAARAGAAGEQHHLGRRVWLVDLLRQDVLRSEEHTSELQSRQYLVCRLLLEKKKHHCYHNDHVQTQNF